MTKLQLDNATASSLPAGTSGQTLRHNGTAWIANSFLYNSGTNIGIGTSSPAAMLDVVGWSDNLSALFGNNTTNNFNKQTYIGSRHYTNAEEPINIIGVVSGSSTSNLRIGGGTSNLNAATEIRLYTAANTTTTTGTARMTIHSNGNIGIGFTTAPAARLDVVGESNDITALFGNVTSLNSSKFANIGLRHYAGSTEEPLGLIAATSSNSINNVSIGGGASVLNAATQIQFYTAANTTTTTGTARMTITSAGLVGIGTTSPGSKLTVHNQGAAATGEALLRLNQYEAQDFIAGHYNGATDASFRVNNSGNVYSTTFYAITDPTYFLSPTGPTSLTTIGDVGIGTNSPSARLEVVGAFGTSTTGLKIYNTSAASTSNIAELGFNLNRTTGGQTQAASITGVLTSIENLLPLGELSFSTLYGSNLSEKMRINSEGLVGIGVTNPRAFIDVVHQGIALNPISALFGSNTTNNTQKFSALASRHYANAEEPLSLMYSVSNSTNNTINVGGGLPYLNAATRINFYTAADTTTTTGTARMTINSSGNVGIGTASPAVRFHVNGNARIVFAAAAANTVCRDANGTFTICSSLAQYKDNKQNLSLGLETIMQLRPVEFDWNINDKSHDLGLIAEEVAAVNPLLAQYESDGSLSGVKYHHMVALLVKGIQQQQGQITSLSSQLAALNPSAITADQLNNFFIDSTGNLVIETTDSGAYQVRDTADNSLATVIGKMAELVVGRLRAGAISVRELDADSITVAGLPLSDYVASVVAQLGSSPAPTNPSELISPVAHLENLEVTGETLLANLLVAEDATFSGTLAAQDLTAETTLLGELTANTATIAGTLVAENIEAGNISAATISAYSTRLALLESRTAEFEHMKAQTAELLEATVSGTLYADNIHGFDSKIASAFNEPTITDILKDKVFNSINTTQNSLEMVYDTIALAGYEASSSADLNLTLADVASQEGGLNLGGATAFIDKYFKVNGIAYVADTLGVGNKLMIGQGTTIADGIIEYTALAGTEQTLAIQPSGRGSLTLMAGLMTLTENGNVIIDGNLAVAGNLAVQDTLLANLVQPADFGNPFQVQVAGISDDGDSVKESRFEIINETGTPVATISAEGRADFAAGIGVGSEELDGSDDAEANTNKTSGRATILAGQSELTIRSKRIGSNSLVYVTPVGSTQNQVLYVKSQRPDDPDTPDNEGKFVVGFDQPVTEDVQFNWWIVN